MRPVCKPVQAESEIAYAERRVKPPAQLLRCATALRVTAPLGCGSSGWYGRKAPFRPYHTARMPRFWGRCYRTLSNEINHWLDPHPPFPLINSHPLGSARSSPGREAAKRTLDGEDRFRIVQERAKASRGTFPPPNAAEASEGRFPGLSTDRCGFGELSTVKHPDSAQILRSNTPTLM